jgi:ribonuclease HI
MSTTIEHTNQRETNISTLYMDKENKNTTLRDTIINNETIKHNILKETKNKLNLQDKFQNRTKTTITSTAITKKQTQKIKNKLQLQKDIASSEEYSEKTNHNEINNETDILVEATGLTKTKITHDQHTTLTEPNVVKNTIENKLTDNLTDFVDTSSTNSFATTHTPQTEHQSNDTHRHRGHSWQQKDKKDLRIYYQNINSLSPPNVNKWKDTITRMNELSTDIVGLSETSVNWEKNKLQQKFQQVLNKDNRNHKMVVSSIKTILTNDYLPGGTAAMINGKWSSRHVADITDPSGMGRYCGFKIRINDTTCLHYITAYRVCNQKLKVSNSLSSNTQQYMHMLANGTEKPNPRQQILEDLTLYIDNMIPTDKFILGIDANEALSDTSSHIKSFADKNNLIDIFSHLHDETEFPTHINGSKRIDFLLCSQNVHQYINRTGVLQYHDGFSSDHRGLFCDINHSLFENNINERIPTTRQIGTNSTNKEGEKYIEFLDNKFNEHNIYKKMKNLSQQVDITETIDNPSLLQIEAEKLDKLITEFMLLAEKRCCKRKDVALWTPELHQSNLVIQYINLQMKSSKHNINIDHRLQYVKHLMTQTTINRMENLKGTNDKKLQQAIKHHKELTKSNAELREKYLQQLIEDLSERDPRAKQSIKNILYREQDKQDFNAIRKLYKGSHSRGIKHIEIPDNKNPDRWVSITDPIMIEKHLIDRNIQHFGQAGNTAFATGKLKELYGYMGTNKNTELLIKGARTTINETEGSEGTYHILKKLSDKQNSQEIPDNITFDEFWNGLNKWNERTTTSPSGRHLGHYKILQRLAIYNKYNENISNKILNIYFQMINVMAKLGGTLTRWCSVSTMMIEKVKGTPRVDKLRVIHLYEADYNLILKIIWARKAVWNAETSGTLHEGQAGSRPNQRAIDVVLRKEMRYSYARLTRTPLGTIDNDAKSCFDRIICNLAMMVSRYNGVPSNFCQLQANTLLNTEFKLRTALGDSNRSYRHTDDNPIHGTGQGSCASPSIWLMLSSLLMNILHELGNGMTMVDILKNNTTLREIIEGFVDDTSIFTNCTSNDIINILRKLQEDGNIWSMLLQASGGKLEVNKCFFYLLSWHWDAKGNPIADDIQSQKLLLQENGIQLCGSDEELKQKDVQTSHKTLGTFKCLVGDEVDHYKFLKDKSDKLGSITRGSQLNRRQAKKAYNSCYIPALLYSLTAVSLTRKQIDKIQQQATTDYIRKCGYDMHFPRCIVYGATNFGGLGFRQLFVESGCNKIQSMVCHINNNTMLGKMVQINLNWVQLTSGLSKPIMESKEDILYINNNWFTQLREFTAFTDSKIIIKHCWTPTMKRVNDINIMDQVNKLNIPTNTKQIFNNWRIFFQVDTLADIVNCSGDQILQQFINRKYLLSYISTSKLNWPQQQMPNEKLFSTWCSILRTITNSNKNGQILEKLESWIVNPHKFRHYNTLIHNNRETLLREENKVWWIYQKSHSVTTTAYYTRKTRQIYIPNDDNYLLNYSPVDIQENTLFYSIYQRRSINIIQPEVIHKNREIQHINFKSYIGSRHNNFKNLLNSTMVLDDSFITNNNYKHLKICSDGGSKDNKGSFGVIFACNKNICMTLSSRVPEIYDTSNSHRSECYGLLASLQMIILIQQYLADNNIPLEPKEIQLYCDNKSAVDTINKTKNRTIPLKLQWSPNFDLIKGILECLQIAKRDNCKISIHHVKGHSDRRNKELDDISALNVQADLLATKGLKKSTPKDFNLTTDKAIVHIAGKKVASNYNKHLRESFSSIQMHDYFKNKYAWSNHTIKRIWWEAHDAALSKMGPGRKMTIHKFIHRRIACNHRESKFYQHRTPMCQACGDSIEDHNHILRCNKCDKRKQHRKKYIMLLKDKLILLGTNQETILVILMYVKSWMYNTDPIDIKELVPDASKSLRQAIFEQNKIGWDQWFCGRISNTWGDLYQHDIQTKQHMIKYPSPKRWGAEIIAITWNLVLDCWYERNNWEHDNNGDKTTRLKEKRSEEITWIIKTYPDDTPIQYLNITKEKLMDLPTENLDIMLEQLKKLRNNN